MAWFKMFDTTREHPKIVRHLRRLLGISKAAAIGHVNSLWCWSLRFAEDGNLSGFDNVDLADAAYWEGDPTDFIDALVETNLLDLSDDGLIIHDWMERAGSYKAAQARTRDRERKRTSRRQNTAPGHGNPMSETPHGHANPVSENVQQEREEREETEETEERESEREVVTFETLAEASSAITGFVRWVDTANLKSDPPGKWALTEDFIKQQERRYPNCGFDVRQEILKSCEFASNKGSYKLIAKFLRGSLARKLKFVAQNGSKGGESKTLELAPSLAFGEDQ